LIRRKITGLAMISSVGRSICELTAMHYVRIIVGARFAFKPAATDGGHRADARADWSRALGCRSLLDQSDEVSAVPARAVIKGPRVEAAFAHGANRADRLPHQMSM
jgi:hypothetical protein